MRMARKSMAMLMAVLLVGSLLLSSVCMACAAGHNCCGKRCPVCVLLARVEKTLQVLALLFPLLSAVFAPALLRRFCLPGSVLWRSVRGTLVGWKIRLND